VAVPSNLCFFTKDVEADEGI
jgi:hypothetical protein